MREWYALDIPRCRRRQNHLLKLSSQFIILFFVVGNMILPTAACCLSLSSYRLAFGSYWTAQDSTLQQGLNALKDNRLDAALKELTTAERENASDARIRNFRGIVLARLGRNAEAADEYREAIRIDSRLEDAYKNLGFLQWTEHNLESARAELERALELDPDDSFAHYYLGRVQLDAKLYANAFQELDRSGVPWPADAGFLIQLATGYNALGRLQEAGKTLDQLVTMPLSDAQSVSVTSLLLSAHKSETAIGLLQKLNEHQAPGAEPWVQFDLVLAYLTAGSYEKAADQAHDFLETRAAGVGPIEVAAVWSLIGVAKASLNQGERAVEAFRQAAKLDPSREEHWLNLTRELMELGHYADAISAVQEGLVSNPKSYALHLRLGGAYLSSGRYSESESVFRQLVASGDPLPTSYIGLAQVLLRTGRAEEAVPVLTAARQKVGPNFLVSYFRGLALDRAGKPGEALTAFKDAARLNPNSSEAHLALGKTELAIGKVSEATAELQESLRLSPGNVQSQRLLSQAYRRAGDTKTASQYAESITEAPPAAEGDLLGDFLLPEWQIPREGAEQ